MTPEETVRQRIDAMLTASGRLVQAKDKINLSDPRSRRVFAFHRPETLLIWVQQEKQLAQRLCELPPLAAGSLWLAQIQAITSLEKSFAAALRRALIQMATGSGKTYTAVNFIYR